MRNRDASYIIIAQSGRIGAIQVEINVGSDGCQGARIIYFFSDGIFIIDVSCGRDIQRATRIFSATRTIFRFLRLADTRRHFFLNRLFRDAILELDFRIFRAFSKLAGNFPIDRRATRPTVIRRRLITTRDDIFRHFTYDTFDAGRGSFAFTEDGLIRFDRDFIRRQCDFLGISSIGFIAHARSRQLRFQIPMANLIARIGADLRRITRKGDYRSWGLCVGIKIVPPHVPCCQPRETPQGVYQCIYIIARDRVITSIRSICAG